MDRRRLWPADDIEGDRLAGIAAEAADLKIAVTGIKGLAEGRGRLRRRLECEHARVPGLASQAIGLLAGFGGAQGIRKLTIALQNQTG